MTKSTGTIVTNKNTVTVRIPAWIGTVESIIPAATLKPDRARVVLHQFFLAWLKDQAIRKNIKSIAQVTTSQLAQRF